MYDLSTSYYDMPLIHAFIVEQHQVDWLFFQKKYSMKVYMFLKPDSVWG